jgi:hypothetical protein
MMMRTNAGVPISAAFGGTVTVKMNKDFSSFDAVVLSGVTTAKYEPAKGTTSLPDPRWNPGVDGKDGFNLEVVIPKANFTAPGTYFVSVSWGDDAQAFRVHVGSGWDGA